MKESEGSREEELLVLTAGSRVSNSVAATACGTGGTARNWILDCTYAGSSIVIIADAAGELEILYFTLYFILYFFFQFFFSVECS